MGALIKKVENIIWNAKKEDNTAIIEVNNTVAPMLVYFIHSELGHFSTTSSLLPEQKINNFTMGFCEFIFF